MQFRKIPKSRKTYLKEQRSKFKRRRRKLGPAKVKWSDIFSAPENAATGERQPPASQSNDR